MVMMVLKHECARGFFNRGFKNRSVDFPGMQWNGICLFRRIIPYEMLEKDVGRSTHAVLS
jgi:hypothetical protein